MLEPNKMNTEQFCIHFNELKTDVEKWKALIDRASDKSIAQLDFMILWTHTGIVVNFGLNSKWWGEFSNYSDCTGVIKDLLQLCNIPYADLTT